MNINLALKRKLIIAFWIIVPLGVLVIVLDWWGMRLFPTRIIGKPVGGQVIERETGKPLADALVIVKWNTSAARGGHGASGSACYHMEYAVTDKDGRFKTERWVIYPSDFDFGVQKSRKQEGGIIRMVKPGYVEADSDWPRHGGSAEFFGQSMEPSDIKLSLGRNFAPGETVSAQYVKYKGLASMMINISNCEILPWSYGEAKTKPPKIIGDADRKALEARAAIAVFQGQAFAKLYPDTLNADWTQGGPAAYARQALSADLIGIGPQGYFGIQLKSIPIELTTKPVANFPDPPAETSYAPNVTQRIKSDPSSEKSSVYLSESKSS
jgi:hypothetical protein